MARAEEAFLRQFPPQLTPHELDLRDLLHRTAICATLLLRGAVPLQRWVERRMPGELSLCANEAGMVLLAQLPPPPPAQTRVPAPSTSPSEAVIDFLATLPGDDFTVEEDDLRTAVLAMLEDAKEKGNSNVTIGNAVHDRDFAKAMEEFLPRDVPVEAWIEKRIGAEVNVFQDKENITCIRLKIVTSGEDREEKVEAFFASLPQDDFSREENALRNALFEFMLRNPSRPNLSAAGTDQGVKNGRATLLPGCVSLKTWIERRVGGEIELSQDKSGQHIMTATPAGRAVLASASKNLRHEDRGSIKGNGKGKEGKEKSEKSYSRAAAPPKVRDEEEMEKEREEKSRKRDEFFVNLPEDTLTEAEEDLAGALLGFLNDWTEDTPPTLGSLGTAPKVRTARQALLPQGISLLAWIKARMPDIETAKLDPEALPGAGSEVFFGIAPIDQESLQRGMEMTTKRKRENAAAKARDEREGGDPAAKRARTRGGHSEKGGKGGDNKGGRGGHSDRGGQQSRQMR